MTQEMLAVIDHINTENKLTDDSKLSLCGHPQCAIVTITPEIATELLTLNFTRNRNMSATRITQYANAIKNGEWGLSTDAIGISKSGYLINGQHRLNAVMESNIPTQFIVLTGIPDDSVYYLDGGLARSIASQLRIANEDKLYGNNTAVAFVKSLLAKSGTPEKTIRCLTATEVEGYITRYYNLCKYAVTRRKKGTICHSDLYTIIFGALGTGKITYAQMDDFFECINYQNVYKGNIYNYTAPLKLREWYFSKGVRVPNDGMLREEFKSKIEEALYCFANNVRSKKHKGREIYKANLESYDVANEIIKAKYFDRYS